MKIVVIGGTGLVGTAVVKHLRADGHEVVGASPSSGVNAVTGEGLAEALAGAAVVVDLANSPSFEDGPVLAFFTTSGRNLQRAELAAGVKHHVALSIVGADALEKSGYLRAKVAQEKILTEGTVPFTIIRATQFFEFMGAIAGGATVNGEVRLPAALFQPIAASDVSAIVAETALAAPRNGRFDIAGPDRLPFVALFERYLAAKKDERRAVEDGAATYFGAPLAESSLVPTGEARLGATSLAAWLGA